MRSFWSKSPVVTLAWSNESSSNFFFLKICDQLVNHRFWEFNSGNLVEHFDSTNTVVWEIPNLVQHTCDCTSRDSIHSAKSENKCCFWSVVTCVSFNRCLFRAWRLCTEQECHCFHCNVLRCESTFNCFIKNFLSIVSRFDFNQLIKHSNQSKCVDVALGRNVHFGKISYLFLHSRYVTCCSVSNHENASSCTSSTTGTSNTVDVCVIIAWQIILNHQVDTINVNSSGCYVSCYEQICTSFAESAHDSGSFCL